MFNRFSERFKGIAAGLAAGLCNGLFGAGGGMITVLALKSALKLEPKRAHATALCVMLPLSVVSVTVYILSGAVPIREALFTAPALTVGSLIGARLLGKISRLWLNRLFSLLMLAAAIKLLFF